MSIEQYAKALKEMFARNGFIETPLSELEIKLCHSGGATLDEAYNLGCDVYCCPDDDFLDLWLINVERKDN